MKILYDHQIFEEQKVGGVSRYFVELINHFHEDIKSEISLIYSDNLYLKQHNLKVIKPIIDFRQEFIKGFEFPGKGRIFNAFKKKRPYKFPVYQQENLNASIQLISAKEYDIFHPTNVNPYFLDFLGNKPFVLTIHDMIHELQPEYFKSYDESKRILSQKANHIIAVSENTKKDIINLYGIKEKKISVIHHGTTFGENREIKKHIISQKDYLLFVGSRLGYKNFEFLIKSIAVLLKENNYELICTGLAFTDYELSLFKQLNVENNVSHCFATDNDLYQLYYNATVFIYPSLYEGFGMPVLEAFASECPVLLANSSSLPEIGGDAALYFDPKSQADLLAQLIKLIENQDLRKRMVSKGSQRLSSFSWQKASLLTKVVYNNVL